MSTIRSRGFPLSYFTSFLPRHYKGYLWISILISIFVVMALSENDFFAGDQPLLPRPPRTAEAFIDYQRAHMPSITDINDDISSSKESPIPASTPSESLLEQPLIRSSTQNPLKSTTTLTPSDILILVKTGTTSLWRRLPMHLSTTLSTPSLTPHMAIYSDSSSSILSNPIIDSLANLSSALKSTADFTLYNTALTYTHDTNLYLESASMEGDAYLPGGWRLDKYKFLPMFAHAAKYHPGRQWYVYMEDDDYFFWEGLYAWLEGMYGSRSMEGKEPLFVGSPAFRLGEDFAHGGSGFAINGVAMRKVFGENGESGEELVRYYEDYAREQCCGDQILSHVLKAKGVEREKGLDDSGWMPLQSLPIWRIKFGNWNWCSPVMNVHKVHQRDISELWEFEREVRGRMGKPHIIRYSDLFTHFALPMIVPTRSEWDNYASAKTYSSSAEAEETSKMTHAQKAARPWYSKEMCHQACREWSECLSWKYADDNCFLDHTAAMGQKIDAGIRMQSGWMVERLRDLARETSCKVLPF